MTNKCLMFKSFRKSIDPGAERYRRATATAAMNVLSQIVQIATGLISVPLALNYVGAERFGIWMTLSTALTFITFSDFGVGIGVQDRMTRYLGLTDYVRARRTFLNALLFVVVIFSILLTVNEVVVPHLDLVGIFSLKSKAAIDEIVPTTKMVVFVLGLGLVSGIVQRAFNSLQEGFWVALIQVVARLISLCLLFVVVHAQMGLPALVFVVSGLSGAVLLLIGLPVLFWRYKWLVPTASTRKEFFDREILVEVMKIGSLGLGAAIAVYFVNNSIPAVIAKKYGAEGVADYAVLLKLVSIPSMFLTYLLLPLWPAITEAKTKNEYSWIKHAYKKCVVTTGVFIVFSVVPIVVYGQDIIFLWTGNRDVVPSVGLVWASAFFMCVGYWNSVSSVILNGLSRYKGQATYGILLAVIFTAASMITFDGYDKESIVWVISVGYFIRCVFMQYEIYLCFRE